MGCELNCWQVGAEPDAAVCALVAELVEQRSMDGQLLPENVAVGHVDAVVAEWLIGVDRCSAAPIRCPTFEVICWCLSSIRACQGTDILRLVLEVFRL